MENIQISKVCGLCAGCKNAIDTATKSKSLGESTCLFKEIVHNKNVNQKLLESGIKMKENLSELSKDDFVIIRAHGEQPKTFEFLDKNKIEYADCTCVNVKKIHSEIQKYSDLGYVIFLIGKYGKSTGVMHPEILGSSGYSKLPPILIEDAEDLSKANSIFGQKCFITFQTTFNEQKAMGLLNSLKNILEKNHCEIEVFNSICGAQKSINKFSAELAKTCDLMIVVGGKNSSNTKELFENVKKITNSIFLENIYDYKSELENNGIKLSKNIQIGLTAGASTDRLELETLKTLLENDIKNL